MHPIQFTAHLQKGAPAPVYLFTGEAELLLEEAWNQLVQAVVPPQARRFNGERLSARDITAAEVMTRLRTLPMFGSRQLIMIQHLEAWPKDQMNILLSYLAKPFPTACLAIMVPQRKGFEKIEAAVESVGIVVKCGAMSTKEAPRWLRERARGKGRQLSEDAAALLVEQVGPDLQLLEGELEKLVTYAGDRRSIELEDVRQVVSSLRSFTVFELIDYVGEKQSHKAVLSLRNLMRSGEVPLVILALLARQIRILWQMKDGLEKGIPAGEIGRRLRLFSSHVRQYADRASRFSEADLFRIHRELCETDMAMKSTGTAMDLILEALILRLCLQ